MKFKTHGSVAGSPQFKIRARSEPIAFKAGAEGSFGLGVGPIDAHVGEIPLKVRIPFLRSGAGVRTVGAIGDFGVRVESFEVSAKGFGVRFDGTLGTEGIACDLDGTVACKMEMDLTGSVPGKVARASLELADGEDMDLVQE